MHETPTPVNSRRDQREIDRRATEYRRNVDYRIFELSRKDVSPEIRSNGIADLITRAYIRGANAQNGRYVSFLFSKDSRAHVSNISHMYADCTMLLNEIDKNTTKTVIEVTGEIVDLLGACSICERRRHQNRNA